MTHSFLWEQCHLHSRRSPSLACSCSCTVRNAFLLSGKGRTHRCRPPRFTQSPSHAVGDTRVKLTPPKTLAVVILGCPFLRWQKPLFHLKRRHAELPNLHLQKPGCCVSLLPVTRSRSRRVQNARSVVRAPRVHIRSDIKHDYARILVVLFDFYNRFGSCLEQGLHRRKGNSIYTQRATCVIAS